MWWGGTNLPPSSKIVCLNTYSPRQIENSTSDCFPLFGFLKKWQFLFDFNKKNSYLIRCIYPTKSAIKSNKLSSKDFKFWNDVSYLFITSLNNIIVSSLLSIEHSLSEVYSNSIIPRALAEKFSGREGNR